MKIADERDTLLMLSDAELSSRCDIAFTKGSGPGGQKRNKTSSAVKVTLPDLGVSATLSELRDAGWRIIRVDIGDDIESEGHVGFPVTIQVRKLF